MRQFISFRVAFYEGMRPTISGAVGKKRQSGRGEFNEVQGQGLPVRRVRVETVPSSGHCVKYSLLCFVRQEKEICSDCSPYTAMKIQGEKNAKRVLRRGGSINLSTLEWGGLLTSCTGSYKDTHCKRDLLGLEAGLDESEKSPHHRLSNFGLPIPCLSAIHITLSCDRQSFVYALVHLVAA